MRFAWLKQLWLPGSREESEREQDPLILELEQMSQVLDECAAIPELYQQVKVDLVGERRADCGSTGLSGEQAVRAGIVKEKFGFSYRALAFHLNDSESLREFVRLEPGKRVTKSVLNRDIRLISEGSWQKLQDCLKGYALKERIEDGNVVRSDTTATETNIHYPTDSNLLWDCIRVLTRLMAFAKEALPEVKFDYSDHNRRAKKRLYKINNLKSEERRRSEYRDLIRVCDWVRNYASEAKKAVESYNPRDLAEALAIERLAWELPHFLALSEKVTSQTIRRVLNGEQVPAKEKIVSIFEVHSDIIEKGSREKIFGHKINVTSGKSGLILDCMILEGNPPDSSLVDTIITRHKESYGKAPEQIAFDGGFASRSNATIAKQHGVKDVSFSKTNGLEILALVCSEKVFKALIRFRAGIEAGISALKRSYGFTRVFAKGWNAFKTSLQSGVAAFNLTLLARHKLAKA